MFVTCMSIGKAAMLAVVNTVDSYVAGGINVQGLIGLKVSIASETDIKKLALGQSYCLLTSTHYTN